jgi:hypothetical protein
MKKNQFNQTKLSLAIGFIFLLAMPSWSQDAKLEIEQKPLPELPNSISGGESVEDRVNAFLKMQKLKQGENIVENRSVNIWVGSGVIPPSSNKNFVLARSIAYQKAMLLVKKQCASYMGVRLSSEMELDMKSPGEARAKAEAERLKREGLAYEGAVKVANALNSDIKAKNVPAVLQTAGLYGEKILQNKVNEELIKKGIDPNKPVDEQKMKQVMNTSSFKKAQRATARAYCSGIQSFATFEYSPKDKQGELQVVAIYTKKLHTIADAMITGDFTLIPKGEIGIPVMDHIPQDKRTLLSTFGIHLVRNELGEYVLLAFAQAQPTSKSEQSKAIAYQAATLEAQGMLRSFMGENIYVTNNMLQSEESTEFEGEEEEIDSKFQSQFDLNVKAVAGKLDVSGIQEAYRWSTLHPSNNDPVVGIVLEWKVSSSQFASMLRKSSQNSKAKASAASEQIKSSKTSSNNGSPSSRGAESSSTNSEPSSSKSVPRTNNSNSGQGAVSRDF